MKQESKVKKNNETGDMLLVMSIDRDNDIGIKIGREGPIIGREENLKTATELAIADPSESDANCIFGAIKEYDKYVKQNKACEIITLTGNRDVGIKSDRIVLKQLDNFINGTKYKITESSLVSDGAEDEQLLPLIRSRIEIVQSKRIIISQSVPLESMYYSILNFSKTIIEDRKLSRVFLGVPAIILLIFTLFGSAGFRIVLGFVAIVLLIKGFYLESIVESFYNEIANSIKTRKYSIILYIGSISLIIIGASTGYAVISSALGPGIITKIALFVKASSVFFFLSAILAGLGKALFSKEEEWKKNLFPFLTYSSLSFSVIYILYHISCFLIDDSTGYNPILTAVGISILIISASIFMEKQFGMKKEDKTAEEDKDKKRKTRR
ncbi:MAG: hypothetical protein DRN66_02470 [Candidatus Nanohalarchaeota archaeon]|nr:MAG: hypothetical protein DRN66_02470 [Candidatus Nanohaloarchaeota archaeon]